MKNLSLRFSLVILCALALIPNAQAVVDLGVSPAAITNDFVGKITLTITGLSAGQTVRVERFTDINGNGVVDPATDGVFRSFTVTDGQLPIIGGVRNLNVPGDDDGAVNGQIRVDLDQPGIDNVFGTASGSFIYRVSDPLSGFTAVTRTFTVAQKDYSQGIRGRVTAAAGGAPLAGAFVVLVNANRHAIGGALADVNGNYELKTLPGSYQLYPLSAGYIVDGALVSATVLTNQFTTNNQALATGAFTISGRLTDATSGAGISGVFMEGHSTNNLFTSARTDTNGNYSFAVSANQWRVQTDGSTLAQLGYLRPDELSLNITNASATNVNFALPKATALIYGTVKDNLNNPVNGVQTYAGGQANPYDTDGVSLAPNANYTLGVLAGTWYVNVESDNLPAGYLPPSGMNVTLTAGQAVQANLVLATVTAHLLGKVVNLSGTPQAGLEVQSYPSGGGNGPRAVTAGDGSFDLGVIGGSWTIQLNNSDEAPSNLIGPQLTFTVTDGGNVNNIIYVVQTVTAQITGVLTNTLGSPLTGVGLYAYATINGTNYNQYVRTDGGGNFSIGVVNGTWQVGVNSNDLNPRGYASVNNQTVTISGANGVANFLASPSAPDTTPPSLVSSSPANGATGVALNSTLSFTFSEPMRAGYSISWSANVNAGQFTYTWSGDQRTLVCTYNTSLPASATISWVLNPSAAGQNFRDLASNALPSNVSGNFTTVVLPPDTTPPSLVSSSPATGATGVALNSSVTFTFSEPMQSGISITWNNVNGNQFSFNWSGDQRALICTYNTSLPASSTISWVLNPSAAGQNFRDLAGNPLPSNVSGSFTTAGGTPVSTNGTWTYKPFMPTARSGPSAAIINGLLYVVGGRIRTGGVTGALEVYDPNQGTWQSLAPMPTPRGSPAVGVINGKLYVAGGNLAGPGVTVLEVYDPVSNTWSNKQPMIISQGDVAAGVISNKLYVVGPSSDFTKSLEVYDPITDTWTLKTPMPNPRGAGAAVLNGLLYTVGGDSFGTVEAYDPTTDSWSSKASLPGNGNTIYATGVAVLNGKLYVAGGYNNGTAVEVYDPASNQWSYGPSMLLARGELAVAAFSDRLFAVGGVTQPGAQPLPFLEQLILSTSDSVVTLVLRSDSSTLAAGLGSGVPSSAMLTRLNAGDTSGLTFQPALVDPVVVNNIQVPSGSPTNTQVLNIPPGNGQNGFFQLSFVLPPGYSAAQISCGATMDYYGRAFLNGNALTPAIDSAQPTPAPGTIVSGLNQEAYFSTKNPAFFRTGTNYVVFADINADGGASAGAFFCLATYRPNLVLSTPVWLPGSQFQFTLTGESGAMYRIEANTSLVNLAGWTAVGTNTASGGSFLFTDTAAPGFVRRFYRAVSLP